MFFSKLVIRIAVTAFITWTSLTTLPTRATAQQIYVVNADRGGLISSRVTQVRKLRSSGQRVEIRGTCLSSCTMLLGSGNVCVYPNAVLGFHGPSSYGRRLQPADFERWSQEIARHYTPQLRNWYLNTARYRTNGFYQISGRELIRMGYKRC